MRLTIGICSILLLAGGCATRSTRTQQAREKLNSNPPVIEIIPADLATTYQSLQKVLTVYKIRESHLDNDTLSAKIQTEFIIGEPHNPKLYTNPEAPPFYNNIRCNLLVSMREGKHSGKKATKVEIQKAQQVRDNYEGWVFQESDRIEEKIVMDQIKEEVYNVLALKRAQEKKEKTKKTEPEPEDSESL